MSEVSQAGSKGRREESPHRSYVPPRAVTNADIQAYKVDDRVRVNKPDKDKSSFIWQIDRAYLQSGRWFYTLKHPADASVRYKSGEKVEEDSLVPEEG